MAGSWVAGHQAAAKMLLERTLLTTDVQWDKDVLGFRITYRGMDGTFRAKDSKGDYLPAGPDESTRMMADKALIERYLEMNFGANDQKAVEVDVSNRQLILRADAASENDFLRMSKDAEALARRQQWQAPRAVGYQAGYYIA